MEVSGQLHGLATSALGKELPIIHWIGGYIGPRAGLDAVMKKNPIIAPWQKLNPSSIPEPTWKKILRDQNQYQLPLVQ
jgi:hypothetical protein